ncbi:MAG: anhydro-N-acetylmuramic acid kinase [Candidatus Poribacteria bacterium]|nr:anhydro-N-acetylmuramic acid kinase [Candidatus Poribacteria bacterium]
MKRIDEIINKKKKNVIGLMSGTSADGVDSALVEIEGYGIDTHVKLIKFATYPFSDDVRDRLFRIFPPSICSVEDICELNFALGDAFADATLKVIEDAGLKASDVDLIGSHGQTICHLPNSVIRSTLQIGEPSVIAFKTGIVTVADFRVADVSAGGHGAPLVPYVDFLLLRDKERTRIIQNIGGIGNVTVLPANGDLESVIAFDTGPGNMIIDETIRITTNSQYNYDHNGEIASKGIPNSDMLRKLLSHPFIQQTPPKTTGREDFGAHFTRRLVDEARALGISDTDLVATVTAYTAECIYENYKRFILPKYDVSEVLFCGGGVHNQTLMRFLRERLLPISVGIVDDYGLSSDAKEAIAFAVLANETIHDNYGNVPNATGASKRVILGKIVM